jgi:hypothetical protein
VLANGVDDPSESGSKPQRISQVGATVHPTQAASGKEHSLLFGMDTVGNVSAAGVMQIAKTTGSSASLTMPELRQSYVNAFSVGIVNWIIVRFHSLLTG